MIPRPVELVLHRFLREKRGKKFLLAISGGLDSMALFYSFLEMKKKGPLDFTVAHVHHGAIDKSSSSPQQSFRDQAQLFLRDLCVERQIPFLTNIPDQNAEPLSSEADLRHFRLQNLGRFKKEAGADYVVFSHHQEDLFETRLLRLIRGTGPVGLQAMREEKGAVLRPFLSLSKKDLKAYLDTVNGKYLEDPSNSQSKYLRNWLRREWLPELEKRYPGAPKSFERSLQLIADLTDVPESWDHAIDQGQLLRQVFTPLSQTDKRRVLTYYLRQQNIHNFSLSHINELIKRLDVERKDLTFRLLQKNWRTNAKHIWCESENGVQ